MLESDEVRRKSSGNGECPPLRDGINRFVAWLCNHSPHRTHVGMSYEKAIATINEMLAADPLSCPTSTPDQIRYWQKEGIRFPACACPVPLLTTCSSGSTRVVAPAEPPPEPSNPVSLPDVSPVPSSIVPPVLGSDVVPAKSGANGEVPLSPLEVHDELLNYCADLNEANEILERNMVSRWRETTEWQRQCLRRRGVKVPSEAFLAATVPEVTNP
jgi:hypothetical protein